MTTTTEPSTFAEKMAALAEPLPIHHVEFRVQSISPKGWATLLAYKDARVDMDRLDGIMGRGYWQRFQRDENGRCICRVEIWNEELKQWVAREDVGTPSNTEAVKGEVSDSFKRACVNLGIGRELYSYPLILVELFDTEWEAPQPGSRDKPKATWALRLREWTWHMEHERDEGGKVRITSLVGIDQNGNERYRHPRRSAPPAARKASAAAKTPFTLDDVETQKPWFLEQFQKGHRAGPIIAKLKETRTLSKPVEKAITDLAVANTVQALDNAEKKTTGTPDPDPNNGAETRGWEDDVPF